MSRAIRGLYRRYATSGEYTWYIAKCIKRVGRLCESTSTGDRADFADKSTIRWDAAALNDLAP